MTTDCANQMKRIAIVVPSLAPGGMERVAVLCANHWSLQSNNKVYLFTLNSIPSFFQLNPEVKVIQPDFETEKLGFAFRALKTIFFLRTQFRRNGIQYGLAFGDRYNSLSLLANLGTPVRLFVSNRQNPLLSNGRLVDFTNYCLYRFAAGIIAQTNLAKTIFLKRYGNSNVIVIPNPIVQYDCNVNTRNKWIICVGRFAARKNQEDLVRIFSACNHKEWHLYLVGDGPKRGLVESAIAHSECASRIAITGFEKEVGKYYYQGSIFAFTSRSEGFPNALAEAMSAGMAVIAYDCVAGPRDLIDDNVNGFLIVDGDERMFQEKLLILMTDDGLRERFGQAAKKKAAEFQQEKIIDRIAQVVLN